MPRDYMAWSTSSWSDPDWTRLAPMQQWLYQTVSSQPRLSTCGVLDYIPARLTRLAKGIATPEVEKLREALCTTTPRPMLIYDSETAELLVRSYIRNDGLIRGKDQAKAIAKDWEAITSEHIAAAVVVELARLHAEHPEYKGWAGILQQSPHLLQEVRRHPQLKAVS